MGRKVVSKLILVVAGIALVGCQGQQESAGSIQSLDNLSAGKVVQQNECRGEFTAEDMMEENRERMLATTSPAFETPLSAVPTIIKDHYFGAGHLLCEMNVNICEIHSPSFDTSSCSVILDVNELGDFDCADAEQYLAATESLPNLGDDSKARIVSFVAKDQVDHGAMRGIAHAWSLFLERIQADGSYGSEPAYLTSFKAEVLQAYLADTNAAGQKAASNDPDVVFAEAVDHFYCYQTQLDGRPHPMVGSFTQVHKLLESRLHPAIVTDSLLPTSGELNLFVFRLGAALWRNRPLVRYTGRTFPLANLGARGVGRVFGFRPATSWVRPSWAGQY